MANSNRGGSRPRAPKARQSRIEADKVEPAAINSMNQLRHDLEVHQIELELQNEELRRTQESLEISLARYSDLFELAPVGYLILSKSGVIIEANLTLSTLLRTDRNNLIQNNLNRFITPSDQDNWLRYLRSIFRGKGGQSCELEFVRGDGRKLYVQLNSIIQPVENEPENRCLTVATDVTERRRQESIIQRQANYDALTDLPNRTLFLDRLAYTIRLASRENTNLALFFIDLDNFKWINDGYGHAAGDRVLAETARRLVCCARKNDTVARLSGDEFCMLLPRVSSTSSASLVAEKVLDAMEEIFLLHDGTRVAVSCSIGIAMYPQDGDNAGSLLKSADIALYQVKQAGRRHFAFFSKSDETLMQRRQELGVGLKDAGPNNELVLHYQPIIELESGRPFGVEALVRWQHEEHGLLFPRDFIEVAESTGSIVELGEWVLKRAAADVANWRSQQLALNAVWVNLSVRQCGTMEGAQRLIKLLSELALGAQQIRFGLEITESAVLELSESTARMFEYLRKQGVLLTVDNFGTGYSSLGRFLHLPIDFIKVDRSFVAKMASSERSLQLVKAIIALGHSMRAGIIAEGIESQAQLGMLRDLGCDYGQGFHISKPLACDRLLNFVVQH